MFCPKCGTKLPDGSRFCGGCGANLATPAQQRQQQQPGAQQAYAPARYAKTAKLRKRGGKKKVVIGVVAAVVVVAVALVAVFGFTGRWVAVKYTNYDSTGMMTGSTTQTIDAGGAVLVSTQNTKWSSDDTWSTYTSRYTRDQNGYALTQDYTSDTYSYSSTYSNINLPDGRLRTQTSYVNGEKWTEAVYSYGSHGTVSSVKSEGCWLTNGELTDDRHAGTTLYDEDGYITSRTTNDYSGNRISSTTTYMWTKDMLGHVTGYTVNTKYDDSSMTDSSSTYTCKTDLFGNITEIYDSNGMLVRSIEYQFVPFACTAVKCQAKPF